MGYFLIWEDCGAVTRREAVQIDVSATNTRVEGAIERQDALADKLFLNLFALAFPALVVLFVLLELKAQYAHLLFALDQLAFNCSFVALLNGELSGGVSQLV